MLRRLCRGTASARPLATLALVCAAVLLVPAAQAFAATTEGTGEATVEITGTGSGEVTNPSEEAVNDTGEGIGYPPMACSYDGVSTSGTCKGKLPVNGEGTLFQGFEAEFLVAKPAAGSAFVRWEKVEGRDAGEFEPENWCRAGSEPIAGTESSHGGRTCFVLNEVLIGPGSNANVKFKAVFAKVVPLTVFITGKGAVSGSGITCASAEECKGEFAEGAEETLTEAPASGYTFAGWLGCKHASTTTCEVKMSAAEEVTAVFVESVTTKSFTGSKGTCTEGGVEVVLGATTEYVCNGAKGAPGAQGKQGAPGATGATGETGAAGATGATGATGPQGERGPSGANGERGPAGANGAQGPAGPAGAAGAAGQVELVTCSAVKKKVKGHSKKAQQCTTKLVSGVVKFTATGARARLSRAGTVYATGVAARVAGQLSLRLVSLRALHRGRYTLTLIGGSGPHEWIHTESFTFR